MGRLVQRSMREISDNYAYLDEYNCFSSTEMTSFRRHIRLQLHDSPVPKDWEKYGYIYIYIYIYKLTDRSREQPEGSLFNRYNTKVYGSAQLLSLDCSTHPWSKHYSAEY